MRLGAVFGESRTALVGALLGGAALVAVALVVVTRDESVSEAEPAVAESTAGTGTAPAVRPGSETAGAEPDAAGPERADVTDAGTGMAEESASAAPLSPEPPSFDQIRVDRNGSAVIAGSAPPGSAVSLRLDGAEIGTALSTAGGDFAAILTLAPSATPRILSLAAWMPDGTEIVGAETVIIAPFGMDEVQSARAELEPESPAAAPEVTASGAPVTEAVPADTDRTDRAAADTGADQPPAQSAAPPEDRVSGPQEPDGAEVAQEAPPIDTAGLPPAPAVPEPAIEPVPPVAEPPALEAPALVVAGPEGLRVLRGGSDGPPEAQTSIRIDAISYDAAGAVTLSGVGMADRRVQVLIDNAPIETGEIGPGGQWSLELPDVDPGTYTLSVAQLAPGGEVESRVDTPFLREDPARIAASPMQVERGVSVITVQPGFTLWGIAEANFGEGIAYVQIFEENQDQIRDPDLIFPGQIFQLPDLPRPVDAAP